MAWVKVTDIAYGRLKRPISTSWRNSSPASACIARSGPALRSTCAAPIPTTTSTSPKRAIRTSSASPIGRERGRSGAADESAGRLRDREHRRAGGGKRVRLTRANGYQIEVVHGIAPVPAIPVERQKLNTGEAPLSRAGRVDAAAQGAGARQADRARRADDAALRETVHWFRETLGFVCSDDVYAGTRTT